MDKEDSPVSPFKRVSRKPFSTASLSTQHEYVDLPERQVRDWEDWGTGGKDPQTVVQPYYRVTFDFYCTFYFSLYSFRTGNYSPSTRVTPLECPEVRSRVETTSPSTVCQRSLLVSLFAPLSLRLQNDKGEDLEQRPILLPVVVSSISYSIGVIYFGSFLPKWSGGPSWLVECRYLGRLVLMWVVYGVSGIQSGLLRTSPLGQRNRWFGLGRPSSPGHGSTSRCYWTCDVAPASGRDCRAPGVLPLRHFPRKRETGLLTRNVIFLLVILV